MSDDERSLYDDVTEYLLQPSLCAFSCDFPVHHCSSGIAACAGFGTC